MMRASLILFALLAAGCSGESAETPVVAKAPDCGLEVEQIGQFVTVPEGGSEQGAHAIYPEEAPARQVHVAGSLSVDSWQGRRQPALRIVDAAEPG